MKQDRNTEKKYNILQLVKWLKVSGIASVTSTITSKMTLRSISVKKNYLCWCALCLGWTIVLWIVMPAKRIYVSWVKLLMRARAISELAAVCGCSVRLPVIGKWILNHLWCWYYWATVARCCWDRASGRRCRGWGRTPLSAGRTGSSGRPGTAGTQSRTGHPRQSVLRGERGGQRRM